MTPLRAATRIIVRLLLPLSPLISGAGWETDRRSRLVPPVHTSWLCLRVCGLRDESFLSLRACCAQEVVCCIVCCVVVVSVVVCVVAVVFVSTSKPRASIEHVRSIRLLLLLLLSLLLLLLLLLLLSLLLLLPIVFIYIHTANPILSHNYVSYWARGAKRGARNICRNVCRGAEPGVAPIFKGT